MRQTWLKVISGFALLFCGTMNPVLVAAGERTATSSVAPPSRDTKSAVAEKPAAVGEAKASRIREGSKLVDQVGEFQRSGEQFNFFPKDGHGTLRVLENLALERVARAWDDNPTMRVWSVSGVVTEFRGENYLLVTRAVLTKTSPGVSQQRSETFEKKDKEK